MTHAAGRTSGSALHEKVRNHELRPADPAANYPVSWMHHGRLFCTVCYTYILTCTQGWLVGTQPTFISDPVVILHLVFGTIINTKPWMHHHIPHEKLAIISSLFLVLDRSGGDASKLWHDHLPWIIDRCGVSLQPAGTYGVLHIVLAVGPRWDRPGLNLLGCDYSWATGRPSMGLGQAWPACGRASTARRRSC